MHFLQPKNVVIIETIDLDSKIQIEFPECMIEVTGSKDTNIHEVKI